MNKLEAENRIKVELALDQDKVTYLPPAGQNEMAKSARTTPDKLSMTWTHASRHHVVHRGIGTEPKAPDLITQGSKKRQRRASKKSPYFYDKLV